MLRRFSARLGALSLLLMLAASAHAATTPAPAAAPPNPCDRPECRQFDFWLGEWDVVTTDGKTLMGTSKIESILGGCVVLENWSGSRGGDGKSFNIWTQSDSLWHQAWVASNGGMLNLTGSFKGGKMVLEGGPSARQPAGARNRITYTPMPNGEMEQRWEMSTNGGTTWQTSFLGIYRKKK